MTPESLWRRVRSTPLTPEELRQLSERAQDCASDEAIQRGHSNWELRAGLWQALAQAAFACEALLAKDAHGAMWGVPPTRRELAGG